MTRKIGGLQVDDFTYGYITAMLWTSDECDIDNNGPGEFSPKEDDLMRIAGDTMIRIIEDCSKFEELAGLQLTSYLTQRNPGMDYPTYSIYEGAGHDFWLTRNRHGSGFWDRDDVEEECRNQLTECARKFGEVSLYQGDDGLLYLE